jgi:hypothetical protein
MHCDFFLRSESEGSKRTPLGSAIDLSCSVVHSCYQLHETGVGSDDNDHQISATLYCSGARVAIASEGARVIVNGAIEQIKSRDAKAIPGFVIDSIVVLSPASRHVDDAKIPNQWSSGQLFLLLGSRAYPPGDHCCCCDRVGGRVARRHAERLLGLRASSSLQRLPRWLRGREQTRGRLCASWRSGADETGFGCARATGG